MAEPTSYADLPADLQLVVNQVQLVLGDTDSSFPWFATDTVANQNAYFTFLQVVLGTINLTQPTTSFTLGDAPNTIYDMMRLGLMVQAIESRMNRWVETPRLQGYSGPMADETEFLSRWQGRLNEIKPIWIKAKNIGKFQFLPGGAGTVDRNWLGAAAGSGGGSVPPILRGLPSWYWGR